MALKWWDTWCFPFNSKGTTDLSGCAENVKSGGSDLRRWAALKIIHHASVELVIKRGPSRPVSIERRRLPYLLQGHCGRFAYKKLKIRIFVCEVQETDIGPPNVIF